MGHPWTLTTVKTDNSRASGIIMNKIMLTDTKAMDMIFHLLCNREQHKQCCFYSQKENIFIAVKYNGKIIIINNINNIISQ